MPQWAPRTLRSVIETNTDAVEEHAIIITILRIAAALEEELIFRHRGNEGLVLNPIFKADFRPRHEGFVYAVAVDPADARANERPRLAGTEVVVVEDPG